MTTAKPMPSVVSAAAEAPIRAELFSVERLEQHAESLAAAQAVTLEAGRPLLPRVIENGRVLLEYYRTTAKAIQKEQTITPAAEWLVDNFFIVEEQLREIRDDLPTGFYRKLPKLASGPLTGYPRVYGLAWAFVAHTDSQFDPDLLRRFVNAYQRLQPLTSGELWAIAITLRVVLVENLRRLAETLVRSRLAREDADFLADSLLGAGGREQISPGAALRKFEDKPLERAFAVQMVQRLRDLDPKVGAILLWLDDRLDAQGTTADEIVRAEHQDQTAMSVTVRNVITSMRLMSAVDWNEFFESVSPVDEILRDGSNFAQMDFATRDLYRHAIEDLSRGSSHSEIEIARMTVQRATRAVAEKAGGNGSYGDDRTADPGYYLIGEGRQEFESELAFTPSRSQRLLRLYFRAAVPGYLGSIFALTAIMLAFPLAHARDVGTSEIRLFVLALLAAIPASDLAIALVNRMVTDLFGPRRLPRLELRAGVPENLRTIIVVPTLLTNPDAIREQVERLEIHYLANTDGDLRFALLSDWTDAASENSTKDDELLAAAVEGISSLNKRHGQLPTGGDRFLLFHRRRVWNECQHAWMGWERKRGKLHELNRLLRGATDTTFVPIGGRSPENISGIRYVITLDADTRLPRGAAARLVGTMAHPLNRPRFSAAEGRVVDGYSIVQPRITPTLPTDREGSLFQKTFSGPAGMDPYAAAISDVYQDLFHEGSYTGKGIYDVDAFEEALEGKVGENSLLSHDLFEGIFARAALVTEIELFEEFPSHYEAAAARQHRWARGDWQLLPWIFGNGPSTKGNQRKYSIPIISRWKMMDNLRRSLSAPTMFLTLLAGWLIYPGSPWLFTAFVLLVIAIPPLLPGLINLFPRPGGTSARSHFRAVLSDLSLALWHVGLTITFLAYQAWLMTDAILRTLIRVCITRSNLLEWMTAAQANYAVDLNLFKIFRRMAAGVLLAAAAFLAVGLGHHQALPSAMPFILLWAASPAIARWISAPPKLAEVEPLSASEKQKLRLIARRTWHFFEQFVTSEDHFLPPDNFQENPKPVVAHRTSPTNIGLYLLSSVAARDFGWIGTTEAMERVESTLATLHQMESFRGHLLNWYDTRDLHPLDPKYVSSVDSGNLAGDLLVLANACRELEQTATVDARLLTGFADSLRVLQEVMVAHDKKQRINPVTWKQMESTVESLWTSLNSEPLTCVEWAACFTELSEGTRTLDDLAQTLQQEEGEAQVAELRAWAASVKNSVESHRRDAELFIPWLRIHTTNFAAEGSFSSRGPEWDAIAPHFRTVPSLSDVPERFDGALRELRLLHDRVRSARNPDQDLLARIDILGDAIDRASNDTAALSRRLLAIAHTSDQMFLNMDFTFLFDSTRKLFAIGYRATDGSLDPNCYDLLASEARLTSFIAIAKGDVPSSHWFRLGRSLTPVGRDSALISWSGSMFEYLMPALVMRSPRGSMLSQTYQQVVRRQIEYGAERDVPWGISESAFNARDIDLTYQYSAFGVPGLGLKRGLSDDLVIAPYATALAAMIDGPAALHNFERLAAAGGRGRYGYYEALDYTPTRVPEGKQVAVVFTYMAHHQGMSLVSLANVLLEGVMMNRFHVEPMMQATELLLQERTPRDVLVARPRAEEVSAVRQVRDLVPPVVRRFGSPFDTTPRTQVLSNGRYSVMLTAAGSGYSRWGNIAISRWREDSTRDCWGSYIFLRDEPTGSVWCAGYQPLGVEADAYVAAFYEDRVEFVRRDKSLSTTLEVVVSSEDDAEVRRVSITNLGSRARDIQVASFAELSLTTQSTDVAHPAFANLFVQTEFVADEGVLLATRRRRSDEEQSVWAAHVLSIEGDTVGDLQWETDRARFVGRGRSVRDPFSLVDGRPLSNTVGSVLDPIFSLRQTVHIAAGTTAYLVFTTLAASTRQQALDIADKYRTARAFERTLTLAWTQAQVQLHHLGISTEEAHLFQRLANAVIYFDSAFRPSSDALSRTSIDISALWSQGISGDLPIVVARIDNEQDIDLIKQLLRAHEYWRMKHLSVDVVIVNEKPSSYLQDLQGSLEALVHATQLRLAPDATGASGRIFLLRHDLMNPQIRAQLEAVARAVLLSRRGTLSEQILRSHHTEPVPLPEQKLARLGKRMDIPLPEEPLLFPNGLGGFSQSGREYITTLREGVRTPEPWVNVIANPDFGFLVSESGAGFTWSVNSHENQLTPWSNDHLTDNVGEAIYLRDDGTGDVWTPTALPIRDEGAMYVARHGQGYSRFQHGSRGILLELLQFVPPNDPIKISRLTVENRSGRPRRLSVTAYAEWVLGASRTANAPYIVTEMDKASGAIFAHSAWNGEYAGRIAFADLGGKQSSYTGDRTEFLGRNGAPSRPAALVNDEPLSSKVGAGLDPCAALQTSFELRAGASIEIVFFLGQAENREQARDLLKRYRVADLNKALSELTREWEDILGAVQISTPDRSMDILLNRWLLYQTLACRIWARAGFYQVSGAYGFRDQLQDVMALAVAGREIFREHILRATARQFEAGDVQHWWHPPSGRGVRTRISDDRLWLPYAVIHFLEATSDATILDEVIPFLEGEALAEGQKESYFQPVSSKTPASLYEHCARALDCSLATGAHGLPLMGTGDWNDGMNRVGQDGKGESIWLGWFQHTVFWEFAKIAEARGEVERAETWRLHVIELKAALEREGWDGSWYRRAYFDDGTPLGSASNTECRIDSIAQSWGVISGGAELSRAARAMAAVDQQLVRRSMGLVLLLTPPFDHAPEDPGYIKGYVPGIRENGGQYTHAAVWTVAAFAALGDGDKATELFRMLNPISHTDSRAGVQRYKVEPYVVAGDVYGEAPHAGRGGWTWYSGSAGWLYRAGIEWLLGFRLRGMMLSIDPCIPKNWPGYTIFFKYHSAIYRIKVENPHGVCRGVARAELDGVLMPNPANIALVNDGLEHQLLVVLGHG